MRVLVTGGTGFLGRHLVRALLQEGHAVRVLARAPDTGADLAREGVELHAGDLRDLSRVTAACQGMDAVCHAGAFSAPWGRREAFLAANVRGTEHVLAGCTRHRVRRLVHISSPSVTFSGRDVANATEEVPYAERHLSYYSWSKELAERRVKTVAEKSHAGADPLSAIILRPKAIFGPGDTSLVPRLLDAARRGRLPQIGDGGNRVDLTYVENVVHAILLALHASAPLSGTYTITNGESRLLWEVVRRLLREAGLPERLPKIPAGLAYCVAGAMEARAALTGKEPLLTRYTVAILARTQTYDLTAARRELGYQPVVPLEEGIRRTLSALSGGGGHG